MAGLGWLMSFRDQSASTSIALELQRHTFVPSLFMDSRDLNSIPYACKESILPTRQSPELSLQLFMQNFHEAPKDESVKNGTRTLITQE